MDSKRKEELYQKILQRDFPYSLEGIETDINKRWGKGISHHPESEKLYKAIEAIDFVFVNDYFCWQSGGDGDNGETLMYIMDIYFEARDKNSKQ